jgi:uncharacterized membrane protein YqaE (UPF0057 family)
MNNKINNIYKYHIYINMDKPNNVNADTWTLFDKIQYGGLGYGAFALPSNFFNLIIAICFPPLGQVINIIGDKISDLPPFITLDAIKMLLQPENISQVIYSFILTALFYIPGLVYVLGNIAESEKIK